MVCDIDRHGGTGKSLQENQHLLKNILFEKYPRHTTTAFPLASNLRQNKSKYIKGRSNQWSVLP